MVLILAVAAAAAVLFLASFNFILAFIVLTAVVALFVFEFVPFPDVDPKEENFSPTYFHARQTFCQLAAQLNAECHEIVVYTDPKTNISYSMDIAILKAADVNAPIFIHTSGVHGVEGFAGSAIQIAALRRLVLKPRAQPQVTTVFVHAVNPYGFAHCRRFNENNVDLNRNNMNASQWRTALARPANFARYQDFDSVFNPTEVPQWYHRFSVLLQAARALYHNGFLALKRAIVTGQYHKPNGIYFGGQEKQQSLVLLHKFLQQRFPRPSAVFGLDVHSGLGPSGMDTIMVESEEEKTKLSGVFQSAFAIESPFSAGAGASSGYQDALGLSTLRGVFDPAVKFLDVTQEFGTVPGILVARAIILENAAYQLAPGSEQHLLTQQMTKHAFYVPTREWKSQVVRRGLAAIDQIHAYLESS